MESFIGKIYLKWLNKREEAKKYLDQSIERFESIDVPSNEIETEYQKAVHLREKVTELEE